MDKAVVLEGLEKAIKDLLAGVNGSTKDLQLLAKDIARTAVELAASASVMVDQDFVKLYKEIFAQSLLLAEMARIRLSRELMSRIQAAVQTAANILIAGITQI